MPFGAIIGAGAGLIGAKMSAGANKDAAIATAQINKAPWEKQQPYVLQGYQGAGDAFTKAQAMGDYQGQYTAGMDPWQTQGLNTSAGYAQNQGAAGANAVYGAGMSSIGDASQFGTNASAMFQQAGQNPTGQITANAGQYASNPYLDGQIDAASRDVTRNLHENQMTGLDLSAAGSGNMDSSRTGVAQGIMQRGAADRIGDISSQMRGAAYNNGLGMAQNQYNTGVNQQLNANGQLMQSGQFGATQIGNGLNLGYNAGQVMAQSGTAFQAQNQNVLNGQLQQYNDQKNGGLDLVGKYMSSINGTYTGGGASVKPTDTFGSVMSGALGGAALYNKWNSGQNTNPSTVGSTSVPYGNSNDSLGSTGDYNMNGSNYFGSYA